MYLEWGFKGCLFETEALKPDNMGNELLVGRDEEIRSFHTRLRASNKIITFDGNNGVGKTSLINIGLYRSYCDFLEAPDSNPLFIPCRTVFQLEDAHDLKHFRFKVLLEIAQTLIEKKRELASLEKNLQGSHKINAWLNDSLVRDWSATIIQFSVGRNTSVNDSTGFNESGFEKAITTWLSDTFSSVKGGVVCVLDNLELLQTSKIARQCLESLRDTVFQIKGIRWALCGANNIILSFANSPRLNGFLESPIEIKPLSGIFITDIYSSREKSYRSKNLTYLPLTTKEFELLYMVLNNNLRTTLSKCHDYCISIFEKNLKPSTADEKKTFFENWLQKEAKHNEQACVSQVKTRSFAIFDFAAKELNGSFSPSQHELFNCANPQLLRPYVKELEDAGLLISQIDEDDNRRKTISITPKGWLVNYSRIISGRA